MLPGPRRANSSCALTSGRLTSRSVESLNAHSARGGVVVNDLPVACTLSPDALSARRQGLLTALLRSAEHHDELANGHRLSFAATDETLALIMKTVSAERHCCQFLQFQITVAARRRSSHARTHRARGNARVSISDV